MMTEMSFVSAVVSRIVADSSRMVPMNTKHQVATTFERSSGAVMRRNVTIRVAHQKIGARTATAEEGRLLEIGHGAVLTMDRTAFDNSGRAVEFGHHCYRPDLYSFEVTLVDK